jgi:hypothetical protein
MPTLSNFCGPVIQIETVQERMAELEALAAQHGMAVRFLPRATFNGSTDYQIGIGQPGQPAVEALYTSSGHPKSRWQYRSSVGRQIMAAMKAILTRP